MTNATTQPAGRRLFEPLAVRLVAVGMGVLVLGALLVQLARGELVYPVNEFQRGPVATGGDYHDFYVAAWKVRKRLDPALPPPEGRVPGIRRPLYNQRFNKPPLVVIVNLPFSRLDQETALRIWQGLVAAAVLAVVWLCARHFGAPRLEPWGLFALIALSYPFAFLVDRGNLDSFSYGLAFGAFLARARGRLLLSCALFALAAHFKPTVLFMLPALVLWPTPRESVRAAALSALGIAGILALTPGLSGEFLANLAGRVDMPLRLDENGSLARALTGFGIPPFVATASWALLAAAFYAKLYRDHFVSGVGRDPVCVFLLCLPFCQAVPQLSYVYGYVLFPLMTYAFAGAPRGLAAPAALALVLSQFPAVTASKLWGSPVWFHWLPSLGLAVLLAASAAALFVRAERAEEAGVR